MIRPLSPEENAANWAACRRYLRWYLLPLVALSIVTIYGAGYAQGLLDGYEQGRQAGRP